MLSSIKDVKKTVYHLGLMIWKQTDQLPRKMSELLESSFKCKICHDIMTPPIIFGTCCGNIIGCQDCTNTWYLQPGAGVSDATLIRPCPLCNKERGYSQTQVVHGFDEILSYIQPLLNTTVTQQGSFDFRSMVAGPSGIV